MLDKFEKKINELKGKINKKFLGVAIFFVFGMMTIFSVEMCNNFKKQKQQVQDEYNKSMYEAVSYINNLEVELEKLQIVNTKKITITTLANIYKQSNMAKENFENIPTNQNILQEACKYLSQVSDYSYSLMKKITLDDKISDSEYIQIANIQQKCMNLNEIMSNIYNDLNAGKIKWDELQKQTDSKLQDVDVSKEVSSIQSVAKTFQDYEGLIYDGAFSDHLLNSKPKSLSNNEVSREKAKEYIKEMFGNENIEDIKENEDSNGKIELYNFDVKLKSDDMVRNIFITKKDCKLYLMMSDRKVDEEKINMNEAKKIAKDYLNKIGIENVEDTYYLKNENMVIINYAAVQDNVILYPDLIKIKIALDTGEVCGIEAQGYIFNNTKRENLKAKISLEDAKEKLNKNINVQTERLAIIPTESKEEVLTYEFKGKINEKEFLVYINASTGIEEKVLMILNTPGGTLTM